jgi:ubiquinone/menaquinone biosynthesis C-methylase UbiE
MVLSRSQARVFYDRFGEKQDKQAFYEDAALDELAAHAAFEQAENVFEFGCGTGRFASLLLREHLPPSAAYLGVDLSRTMVDIARERLAPFGRRAKVMQSDGSIDFPLEDGSVDRVVSTYVLDLLPEPDIHRAVSEAHRVLAQGGGLCLVSLTRGVTPASRTVCALWSAAYRLRATLVGGCRPLLLEDYLGPDEWAVEHRNVVSRFGVPSEVLIARPENTPDRVW